MDLRFRSWIREGEREFRLLKSRLSPRESHDGAEGSPFTVQLLAHCKRSCGSERASTLIDPAVCGLENKLRHPKQEEMAPASAAASSSLLLFSSLSSPNPRLLKSPISSLPIPSNSFISSPLSSSCRSSSIKTTTTRPTNSSQHSISPSYSSSSSSSSSASTSPLEALIFDCDGVILESEHLHRTAYNDAFSHFDVRCPPSSSQPLLWDPDFYDVLQNQIGGGKPKMRWYFGENGWPSSKVFGTPPAADSDREKLIDTIQDWKTERYKEIIKSGSVKPRPGVLRLMDEAKAAGIKLAVCSAATKSSVILCLENLIGLERFHGLDCFLAGDDVKEKKPDPSIYLTASKKLGVLGENCLVVEDSVIGLQAAAKAGMSCLVTYTSSTANQDFKDAISIYPDLSNVRLEDLVLLLQSVVVAN